MSEPTRTPGRGMWFLSDGDHGATRFLVEARTAAGDLIADMTIPFNDAELTDLILNLFAKLVAHNSADAQAALARAQKILDDWRERTD